ncbi:MAG TPA: acyl-CoA dehydrogenase family protein [Novosphingobium sp.]
MTVVDTVLTGEAKYQEILATVKSVAGRVAERRNEIDEDRRFPLDLFEELEAVGTFKVCGPRKFGGHELNLNQANELIIEGARGTGSMGWLMMVSTAQSIGGGLYPEETVARNNSQHKFLRTRGVIAPKGKAVPVEGGYMVSGQWPFASGGPKPHYVSGHCIIQGEDGKPLIGPNGPASIMALLPANQVEFLDTWHTLGMRGTDSCDVRVKDVFVPENETFDLLTAETCFDTPAGRLPLRVSLSFTHCALALGIAEGSLDDVVKIAMSKSASMNPQALLRNDPLFRDALGRNRLRLTSLRCTLDQITQNAWNAGVENRQLTPEEILTARGLSNFITQECLGIVNWAYQAGGSTSVYNGSSLQMRLRDINVATQHAACSADPYRLMSAVLLGEELTPRELF